MSLSIQKMVSDGTLSTIVLGVQCLQRNDIYLRIGGVATPQSGAPSGYTWSFLDNNTIRVLPVVPAGVEVVVYRRTDLDEMYNIYSQNAQFDESTIDENNQQLLYIAQEYFEQGIPAQLITGVEYVRESSVNVYYRFKLTDGSYTEEFPVPKSGGANAGIKTFPTVADMLLMSEDDAAAALGSSVKTDVNNSVSKVGGWDYRITTLANERITRGDPAWVPDGGLSPANIIIGVDHYLKCGDGLTYVAVAYNDGTMLDGACGVIGHTRDGIYDDGPALNKLISYCRKGSAIGSGTTGGTTPKFKPRSRWYINETINLIDFNVSTDWGQSELRPITPISAIAYEQSGTEFSGLQIWYDHLDPQAVYESQQAAFVLSKGQPVAIVSESPFSKISRVWIYYAYQGFRLYAQSPAGGLFWQFEWDQCLTWNTHDYGWYLWSVTQVSTTTQFNKCHAKNVNRAIVKHNSKNYAALQHMLPTTVVEPGVTTGWRDYWLELPTYSDTRSAWASGTFYSSCGKAYFGRNVQTVTFDDSSADGGVNFEEGNVMNFFNSGVTINSFHLEGTNLNFVDRCPIIIDADCSWDYLYLYDLRVQLPLATDECALIGGTLGRERFLTLQGTRNHAQNAARVGQFRYVRAAHGDLVDFNNISVGPGVDPAYVIQKEMCQSFTSARWNSRVSDLMFTLVAAGSYAKVYETVVPATGSPTAVYQEFSDLLEITANCGNTAVVSQQVGKYAKVRVSMFVQSGAGAERSVYDVSAVLGDAGFIYQTFDTVTRKLALWVKCSNPGQLGVVSFSGREGGYDSNNGKSRMLYSAVKVDGATVEAMAGFKEVQGVSMGALPQLAPDLLFPSQTGASPLRSVSANVSTGMTTVLNITGKGMISYLDLYGQGTTGTAKIKLTIDGVPIWDDTTNIKATSSYLLGSSEGRAGTAHEIPYVFNQSLKLEYYKPGVTDLIVSYVTRPIK